MMQTMYQFIYMEVLFYIVKFDTKFSTWERKSID
jgi:hypothetical protein